MRAGLTAQHKVKTPKAHKPVLLPLSTCETRSLSREGEGVPAGRSRRGVRLMVTRPAPFSPMQGVGAKGQKRREKSPPPLLLVSCRQVARAASVCVFSWLGGRAAALCKGLQDRTGGPGRSSDFRSSAGLPSLRRSSSGSVPTTDHCHLLYFLFGNCALYSEFNALTNFTEGSVHIS